MKKINALMGVLLLFSVIGLVYAWAIDTDGGYNIDVQGTCSDNYGNYTDFCIDSERLVEYYPSNYTQGNETIDFCANATVICSDFCNTRSGSCDEITPIK